MQDTELKPIRKNFGVIPKPLPRNHPNTHQLYGTPSPANLGASFDVGDFRGAVDQGSTSLCTQETTTELCCDMDRVVYDENWAAAMTSKLNGAPIINGVSALTAMEAMTEYGPLLKSLSPAGFTWQEKGVGFVEDWNNWPAPLYLEAAPNERKAVVAVDGGQYDAFDTYRAQMQLHNRSIGFASKWYYDSFNSPGAYSILSMPTAQQSADFTYHMYAIKGWATLPDGNIYLKIKPWEGAGYGAGGYAYLSRAIVNMLDADPNAAALMFADVPASLVQSLLLQNQSLLTIFKELLARLF